MAELNYAMIKDSLVVGVIVFDDPSEETLNHFREYHEVDLIIPATDKGRVGNDYDGEKFWFPKPYPSWSKNQELNEWEAPIPFPEDGNPYFWDETTTSWVLAQVE